MIGPHVVKLAQKIRGDAGYSDGQGVERLNVLDFQRQIRTCPKPVIAMVAGYAIGGGHVLHVMCDLTIAAENAVFGQTGPRVGSFDGGYGASYLARIVGQKKAREIWYLCRQYNAQQALKMGLVNTVVPLQKLEEETVQWCREILTNSPIAIRCLKAAMNADCDGQAGLQELAGNTTMLFYMTEEGQEGRNAFVEKRKADYVGMRQRAADRLAQGEPPVEVEGAPVGHGVEAGAAAFDAGQRDAAGSGDARQVNAKVRRHRIRRLCKVGAQHKVVKKPAIQRIISRGQAHIVCIFLVMDGEAVGGCQRAACRSSAASASARAARPYCKAPRP